MANNVFTVIHIINRFADITYFSLIQPVLLATQASISLYLLCTFGYSLTIQIGQTKFCFAPFLNLDRFDHNHLTDLSTLTCRLPTFSYCFFSIFQMHARSRSLDLDSFDPKIERILKVLRKQKRASSSSTTAEEYLKENKVLRDYISCHPLMELSQALGD